MKITLRVRASSARFCLLLVILVGLCTSATVHARSTGNVNDSATSTGTNCDQVQKIFHSKNITFIPTVKDSPNTICGSNCCGEEMEKLLKQQSRAKFHSMIHHHSKTLQGLLDTTAKVLRGTVIALLRKSENKTLTMFDQVYRSMAVQSRPSIRALYQALVDYVSPANTPDNLQQPVSREMLQERFAEFFTQLFPIAYHNAINPEQDQQDFTDKFKACLNQTMEEVQPFGDVPQEIFKQIGKSLEATRVLVQALTVGKTVLEKTDSVLFIVDRSSPQQEACYDVLLRMSYCARCKGIKSAMPCVGFCINAIRGCLSTEPTFELDLAWSGYVEAVERLVAAIDSDTNSLGLNLKEAVRRLDSRISDAIMHAMEIGPQLEEKVRKVCGRSELLPPGEKSPMSSDAAAKSTASLSAHATVVKNSPHGGPLDDLHKQLGNFLASVVRSRIFYGTLAETVCEEYSDTHCWNGERVGEYAKTMVDISPNAQRYNPEFTVTMMSTPATYAGNANTTALIDQLRHINQVVQSQLAMSPDGGAFLADEALEGSGSGDRPVWPHDRIDDDEDVHSDDRDDDEASGSGMGPSTTDTSVNTHPNPSQSGSSTILLSSVIFAVACATFVV